jgi:plasmid stabilization system protein ParE
MKYRVIITPEAESDLKSIYRYIRKQGAPQAARNWLAGARKRIKSLSESPERGSLAPEWVSFDEAIRELLYGNSRLNYRILYIVINTSVFVLHIRHGARLPMEPDQ